MARIQGIHIELSASADGIEKALSDVNKASRKTTTELGQINRALRLDPENTVLLQQKFEVLQGSISNTATKLDALKKAQADLDAQAASGKNIAPEQFRALAREIEQTEGILRGFKNQAENVQVKLDAKADTSGIEKMKASLKELGPAAKQAASEIGSALSTAGAAGTAAVAGLAVGMSDTNKDLAMLATQISQVGLALEDIGNARTTFDSVGQETDQVTEAMGNLIQAGYQTKESIDDISSSLAGAIVKYGDTFNVEGLAESITTTTQLGEVTGQLTDLLEKEGINVENFNAKIQSMSTEQERANYISQLLADQGLTSLYNKYAEGNAEIVNASSAQISMTDALSQLSVALTPLVTTVSEFVTKIVEWANENQGLATTLAIAMGAVTAIAGAFAVLSPVVSGITALWPVLVAAIGAISAPVAIAVAAIGAIGIAAVVVGKEMSESSIQIADWSSKVSESTAQAVGGFLELSDNATTALNQLAWSGATVTQEMATNLIGIYDQMGQQVLTEMQSDHATQLQEMTNYFASSVALTETEEAEILAKMQQANADKEKSHQESQARITEILNTAKDEKRAITEAEQQEINQIQQTMTENAIEYLTENEREQKVILENLKNEASEITAEQAAEVVKNSVKQKDDVVKEAQDQYDKVVAEIIKQRDEMGTISEEQAEKLIQEAKKQRDETVSTAEDMHEKVVSEAQKQAEEHVEKVDWETGEIKSKWEVLKTEVSNKMGDIGSAIEKGWNDALNGTKNKVTDIKQSAENKFNEMKTAVENKMSEVKSTIEKWWNQALTFLKGINLTQIGRDIIQGLINGIKNMAGDAIEAITGVVDGIVDKAKSLLKIKSPSRVMMEVGKWTAEGLAVGIEENSDLSQEAARKMAQSVIDIRDDLNEQFRILDAEQLRQQEETAQKLATVQKTATDAYQKYYDFLFVGDFSSSRDVLAAEEFRIQWEEAQAEFDSLSAQYSATLSARFENEKLYIDERLKLNEMSLQEELTMYRMFAATYAEQTEQRVYYDNLAAQSIDKIKEKEAELTKAYNEELERRTETFYSFSGLFDEVTRSSDVSGAKLIQNLQDQITKLNDWENAINELSARGLDTKLVNELRDLGVNAVDQIMALNSLTDEELSQYEGLWEEKYKRAREVAEAELEETRIETEQQIASLNAAVNSDLNVLVGHFQNAGTASGDGLINGLNAKKSEIIAAAQNIADAVSSTIQSALDINSPSKLTMGFGVNVGEGLVLGMDDMISKVAETSQRLANATSNAIGSLASSSGKSQAFGTSSTSSSVDNSRHFAPSIVINTNDSGSNAMDRTLRRLALKFN